MHILEEKFGSSCTNVQFLLFIFFFWESRALCSPPWEEHLSALHRPSLPPASSAGLKTQWGSSSGRYTDVYVPGIALTSCFCSLLPTPSWKNQKGGGFPEPGTVSPSEQRWCGQERRGHGLCPSAQGWAGQPGQGSARRSCAGPARWDAQLLPPSPRSPETCVAFFPNRLPSEV